MSVFTAILDGFSRQKGVRASLAVSARDGIAIESNLQIGQDGMRVAALAAPDKRGDIARLHDSDPHRRATFATAPSLCARGRCDAAAPCPLLSPAGQF